MAEYSDTWTGWTADRGPLAPLARIRWISRDFRSHRHIALSAKKNDHFPIFRKKRTIIFQYSSNFFMISKNSSHRGRDFVTTFKQSLHRGQGRASSEGCRPWRQHRTWQAPPPPERPQPSQQTHRSPLPPPLHLQEGRHHRHPSRWQRYCFHRNHRHFRLRFPTLRCHFPARQRRRRSTRRRPRQCSRRRQVVEVGIPVEFSPLLVVYLHRCRHSIFKPVEATGRATMSKRFLG